jgi:hypothetical protein
MPLLQWQAQPLGLPSGRHPTVGAKSMPEFLVSEAGGKAPHCQVGGVILLVTYSRTDSHSMLTQLRHIWQTGEQCRCVSA